MDSQFYVICPILIFNFGSSELLSIKIKKSNFNYILNWISIGIEFFATCASKFFIFVANELLGVKTENSKSNKF